MPILRHILKDQICKAQVNDALLDTEVVGVRINDGAPCSLHSSIFEMWPGDEENVHQWFILANGVALAVNEDPVSGPICVVRMRVDD
ncbi:MAG: hypothetical protein CMF69_05430 [Magnetovibrio sp.]|nr:hypothetical protein [Magnetovibrio sp.]